MKSVLSILAAMAVGWCGGGILVAADKYLDKRAAMTAAMFCGAVMVAAVVVMAVYI